MIILPGFTSKSREIFKNCKNSGVNMVQAYGLVAITCIINGPFDNESIKKRAKGMLDAGM